MKIGRANVLYVLELWQREKMTAPQVATWASGKWMQDDVLFTDENDGLSRVLSLFVQSA